MAADAGRVATQLAAWRLPGARSVDLADVDFDDLLISARLHKLVGVLAAAVGSGDVALADDHRELLAEAHHDAVAETLVLEDVMLEAVEVLAAAGVETRVLKGSALAHLVHEQPEQRSFGDTDLLVRGRQIDAALDSLGSAGATRVAPPLSRDFDRRFAKSITLRWRRNTELDLHRTLAPGPYGALLPADELWAGGQSFELAGSELASLLPEHQLIHAAYHIALGDIAPRLGNLRDLGLMLDGDLATDSVIATARQWGGEAVLAAGLCGLTPLGVAPHPLVDWALSYDTSDRDRRLLAVYRHRPGRFAAQARATLTVLPWRDRWAYGRAIAFPSRSSLETRGRTRSGQMGEIRTALKRRPRSG